MSKDSKKMKYSGRNFLQSEPRKETWIIVIKTGNNK